MQAVSSPGSRIGNGEAKSPAAEKNGSSRNGTMEQVKKLVSRLQTSSAEISTVAEVIDQVAKHTNLLALSANIEAARLDTRFTRLAAARHGIRYVIEDLKEADLGPTRELLNVVLATSRTEPNRRSSRGSCMPASTSVASPAFSIRYTPAASKRRGR